MSFRYVTIEIPDVNDVTHRKRGLRFEKKVSELNFSVRGRRLTFGAHRGLAAGVARGGGGGDGKVFLERLYLSLPHVENPFKLKGNKSFVPELRSRKCFFFFVFFWILMLSMCVMDIMNVLRTGMNMSISNIHVWQCYMNTCLFLISSNEQG